MPKGFRFPNAEDFWTALRANPMDIAWGEGPWVRVFGRLADGVTPAQANAELFTLGQRIAAEHPDTHRYLRAEVTPFTDEGIYATPEYWLLQFLALLLLAVACGNVGTLILARTAMRSGEIAVRTALGASRARVVGQIFIEALVLAVLGAGFGLLIGYVATSRLQTAVEPLGIPFWFDAGLRWQTSVAALGLAVFSATVAGVVPGLKATGRDVQRSLQRAAAGVSGIRFGGVSTALIVAEVALATTFLTIGGQMLPSVLQSPDEGMGITAAEYLSARLAVAIPERGGEAGPVDTAAVYARMAATEEEILRRLSAAPGVRGVALGSSLPGEDHRTVTIEVEGADFGSKRVRLARVDVGFVRGLGKSVVQGRDFQRADVVDTPPEQRSVVVVNTSFVKNVLDGRSAVGRRIRYAARQGAEPGPWLEIVGVVGHLGMNEINPDGDDGFYLPAAVGELSPGRLAIHLTGDPLAFVPELRRIVAEVDADAMVREPRPLDDNAKLSEARLGTFWLGGVLVPMIAGVAIVLSAAGLFALVSFTVSERRREIGIRTALGARSSDIVHTIARRAFLQLACGIVAGLVLRRLLDPQVGLPDDSLMHAIDRPILFTATAAATLAIGLLACVPPLVRGLRIQPVEVLKEVG
jgi:predicted permease